jgi:hypothetical protein
MILFVLQSFYVLDLYSWLTVSPATTQLGATDPPNKSKL